MSTRASIAMGQGDTSPNIWTGDTITSEKSIHAKLSTCLYFTRRNVELWILCNVLFVGMVPFNHKAVMVKIKYIFQVILAVDFMAFILPKCIFYFNADKVS